MPAASAACFAYAEPPAPPRPVVAPAPAAPVVPPAPAAPVVPAAPVAPPAPPRAPAPPAPVAPPAPPRPVSGGLAVFFDQSQSVFGSSPRSAAACFASAATCAGVLPLRLLRN